ncbi:MAG: undecaprenyl-diphosphate phosphatase [Oxalobacter sp.]|nr:MAG: undecaprenyl-diphosphate phosphatase [Oxalobacter sp.]
MDLALALKAFLMGLVEGFTEFLPISSTGHLILAGSLLEFNGEKEKVFNIAIQSGAMLAVLWEYRVKIWSVASSLNKDVAARKFALNLLIAFLPAGIAALLFSRMIKECLFSPIPVALAFIIGGVVILLIERHHNKHPIAYRINSVDEMTPLDAFKVGCMQALALIPGTSRSGATIIGGLLFGMSRKAATEFSFFLAIPTLFAAGVYSLIKERALLSVADLPMFGIGGIAAFISAFLCVRWLLRYISTHDFTVFAWYRIGFGIFVIISAWQGWVVWVE